jgi:sigma-B regulation protein RsbU (phosphoserine phosphatase)
MRVLIFSDIVDSVEKTRIQGELAIASTVQKNLFPPPKFQNERILVRSFYQTASECGGDWWGILSAQNRLGLFIADATGHGIPSALVTASARSCFSVIQKMANEDPNFDMSPSHLLSFANRAVYEASSGSIMMTFFAAVLDYHTNILTYASAGHNPPWLFQQTSAGDFQMKSLTARGVRLGETREAKHYEQKSVKVGSGDILFLYTDGIIEGKNRAGVMYGKKQLRKTVEGVLADGPDRMLQALVTDFSRHNEAKPLDDDVTLTAAKIL